MNLSTLIDSRYFAGKASTCSGVKGFPLMRQVVTRMLRRSRAVILMEKFSAVALFDLLAAIRLHSPFSRCDFGAGRSRQGGCRNHPP